jgi:uncharacterized protein (DUF1800 family)
MPMIPPSDLAAIRFGLGLPGPGDPDPAVLLAGLAGPDPMLAAYPGIALAEAMAQARATLDVARRARKDKSVLAEKNEQRAAAAARQQQAQRVAFARALDAPSGFRERLVLFWADHFTVRAKGGPDRLFPAAFVDEAIRPHVAGRFTDILRAATLHPAMLSYLDQTTSTGPNSRMGKKRDRGLNENLARELLELHTLGVGSAYSQADVTQMAELLTGLTVAEEGFVFRPQMAEPGAETVLGVTYEGRDIEPVLAALTDLAARPETAAHIARKLAVHFVADDPDPALVAAMTRAFADSGGDLAAVYGAMLAHPAAWTGALAKVRQPFEFVLATLRALGFDGARVTQMGDGPFRKLLVAPLALMGQPWQQPRGPDGWPEAPEAWITPQLLAQRVTWAMAAPARLMRDLPEPASVLPRALGAGADERVAWAALRAETRAEGLGVIFASPMFNRR